MSRWPIAFVVCALACGDREDPNAPLPADVQAVLDFDGHAVVAANEPIAHYRDVVAIAGAIDPEVVAAQPFTVLEVVATLGDRTAPVMLKGVPPSATGDAAVTDYERYLVAGRSVRPSSGADEPLEVVMGTGLARRLHARMGDTLTLVLPIVDGVDAKAPRSTRASVVGIMYVPMIDYGDRMAITSLPELQAFGGAGDVAMGVELRMQHRAAAPRVSRALGTKLGSAYQVMDWCQLHKALWKAMGRHCP
jgi:ABC-type lipoprotein release transport system permease subunit